MGGGGKPFLPNIEQVSTKAERESLKTVRTEANGVMPRIRFPEVVKLWLPGLMTGVPATWLLKPELSEGRNASGPTVAWGRKLAGSSLCEQSAVTLQRQSPI